MLNRPVHLFFSLFFRLLLSLILVIFSYAVTAKDTVNMNLALSDKAAAKLNAQTITLTEAKDLHFVGETFSGFIAPLKHNIPETRLSQIEEFVNQINQLRQVEYSQIAKKNVLDPDMIAKIAGEKLVTRESKNHYVKGLNGQWILIK